MELKDVKGIDAILEQAGIYSVVSEQLADNLQDFKLKILSQKNEGDYDDVLKLLDEAESMVYKASYNLSLINAKNE
ncbi:hypothetical protein [Limosilactobacillus caccae]|uniref:hypothetical protein n=1 Tax=Limosilactobacillus caccae TaxID=1926284 RepID=UPI000970B538|nr:hypothetical protein [Limosilactobacillus caccae]